MNLLGRIGSNRLDSTNSGNQAPEVSTHPFQPYPSYTHLPATPGSCFPGRRVSRLRTREQLDNLVQSIGSALPSLLFLAIVTARLLGYA